MIKHEGIGWRLEKDISRKKYIVLVGGDHFAFELSDQEWEGLRKVISKLIVELDSLKDELMAEEKICLELEIYPWWACIDGNRDDWSLNLILSGENFEGRGLECFWPIPAGKELVEQMRLM